VVPEAQIQENYLVPHDLRTLEAEASHQTLLIKREGVDAAVYRVCSEAPGHTLVHDDNAWPSANLPAARVVYPVHSALDSHLTTKTGQIPTRISHPALG